MDALCVRVIDHVFFLVNGICKAATSVAFNIHLQFMRAFRLG